MFAKRRSNNRELFDYICAGKLQGGGSCTCQNLAGRQADRLVLDWLMERVQGDGGVCRMLAEHRNCLASQVSVCPTDQLDLTIQRKQQEIASLVAALAAGESEPVARHVNARIEELDGELSQLVEEKARLEKAAGGTGQVQLLSEELGDWKRCFPGLTIQEKRAFLRLFVERLEWDGRDLHLYQYERDGAKKDG